LLKETLSNHEHRYIEELRMMLSRFPSGLQLSQGDLAFTGWLYYREEETGQKELSNREMISLLGRATKSLGIEEEAAQPAAALERLLRFRIVRSVASGYEGSYALTRLGRSLAKGLLSEVNFTGDDLCTQLNSAYAGMQAVLSEDSPDKLYDWLRFVFQRTVQESIDYKLRGIEEELQSQEQRIKECGSGGESDQFEDHLEAVRVSRKLLEELLDAVQEGSSYFPLIEELYRCREKHLENNDLLIALDRSLDFLEGLKRRVEAMLAHLVAFIRSCVKYQGFVGAFSMRDRLSGVQMDLIRYALQNEVRLSVLNCSRTVRLNLEWNKDTAVKPVRIDSSQLAALAEFIPEKAKVQGAEWRDRFLAQARMDWVEQPHRELVDWIVQLIRSCSLEPSEALTCLWLMIGDMPEWKPDVFVNPGKGWSRLTAGTFLKDVVFSSPENISEAEHAPR
jgi:hypothetical protein